ncbi:Molybdopterin biosynthesis protein MoeA [Anopheles sinensis]|uniref:Molybdopterin biosynthesis protein MoeA n=1 Tax=Anopheles sinensis TaxID=74873 RepID=A0A084VIM9_ANOSI|nr:Molybdopterin biosynthesis protein MoeA [Anopheles sinensis]
MRALDGHSCKSKEKGKSVKIVSSRSGGDHQDIGDALVTFGSREEVCGSMTYTAAIPQDAESCIRSDDQCST